MRRFEAFVTWFNGRLVTIWSHIYIVIAAIILPSIVLVMAPYVLLRKFTEVKIYFVEEWSAFLVALLVYFSITYALMMKAHIVVDIAVRHLSEGTRLVLELLTGLISTILVGFLLMLSISFFLYNWEENILSMSVTHSPMWIPTLFVPMGLALFVLGILGYSLQKVVELVHYVIDKKNSSLSVNSKG